MRRSGRAKLTVAAIGAVAMSSCGGTGVTAQSTPTCDIERNSGVLVLEAQSVPSADRVPCISLVPAGWRVAAVEVKSGSSRFNLGNDRAGDRALEVRLTATCDLRASSQVPSDEPGTQRFERIDSVGPGFEATRFYTFKGGCVSYIFRFESANRALVNEATLALSFITRQEVAAEVRRSSDGSSRL